MTFFSQFLTSLLFHYAKPGHLDLTLGRTRNSLLMCLIFVGWTINILTRNLSFSALLAVGVLAPVKYKFDLTAEGYVSPKISSQHTTEGCIVA